MKRIFSIQTLTLLVLFSLMSILSAQGTFTPGYTKVYSDSWGGAGFSLESQASTGVEINHSIREFSLEDIEIDGEPMQVLHLPGNFLPGEEGAPDLPGSGRYIALPQGATASLRIMDSRTEIFHDIDIAPAFRIPLETEVGPLEYRKNMDIYSTDAYYPSSPVILSEPTQIRGVDVVIVGIKPFQYNPVTRELIVYRDLRVEVNFDGGNGHFGEDRLRSRWWDPVLRDVLINYASLPEIEHRYKSSHTDVVEDVEYLIIVPDDPDFIAWADSIKVFRTLQGIRTGVVTTTELGGNTTTAIETYIDNAYASWDPAPVAVLLLADYGTSGSTIISPVWDNYCISDNIYADYNNNQLPDMSFARITAQDASDLSTMIGKFLDYERQPPTNPNYYQHPVAAGGWQSDRWFILCSDIIWGFWNNELNKQPVREYSGYSGAPPYWSTNSNTSLIVNYFGPNGLGYIPATPSHLTDWGANATRINADINSGAFMMQHRDHGSETGWGDPSYHISDLSGLDNDDLVFVFSVNCLTGKFNWYSECFAEAFHRHDKGALGIVAASEISYSFVNDTYVWGMYDNMWPDFDPGYGGNIFDTNYILPSFASASGKYYLQVSSWPSNPYSKNTVYYLFHHHGDAFTTVYTEFPQNLTVTHDPVLVSGVSSFTVTADIGSFISLTVDGEIIGVGDGYSVYPTVIPISPQLPGNTMEITVTKQNYYRYSLSVPIIAPDGPYIIYNSHTINDSCGNYNGLADYGEYIFLNMTLENLGNQPANNVSAIISTNDGYITITDDSQDYGIIPANSNATENDAFSFTIPDSIPDQYEVYFELEVTGDTTDVWDSSFDITLNAPYLTVGDMIIDDSVGGNNNGRLDPGETADIIISTGNEGHADSPPATGTLICLSEYITLNISTHDFDIIYFNTTEDAVFNITVSADAPIGTPVFFTYDLSAGSYGIQESYVVSIGLIIDDFETGDFSRYPWEFAGYIIQWPNINPIEDFTIIDTIGVSWSITTDDAYEGVYSAKSGDITHNQASFMSVTADVLVDGAIEFYYRVACEYSPSGNYFYDGLIFYIDDIEMGRYQPTPSGGTPWTYVSYPVSSGSRTFSWAYVKDGSDGSTGMAEDCAWLDYIIFPPSEMISEDVSLTMTPLNPPVEIPTGGGTFDYNVMMVNNTDIAQTFYAVLFADIPNGSQYGPISPTPYLVQLPAGGTIDVDLTQNVPGNAPAGVYTYYCLVGTGYNSIIDSSGFTFTKLGTAQAGGIGEWISYYRDSNIEMRENDMWTVDGIYRENGTLIYGSMAADERSLPVSFALYQNYPNPFNPVTTIRYDLPEQTYVTIVIYDILGRTVRQLVSSPQDAGYKSVVWDGKDKIGGMVGAGIYIYQIRTDGFTQTRKMLLLK